MFKQPGSMRNKADCKTLVALLLALLLIGAEAARSETVADGPVILVLGDSLSAAFGMATAEGWVSLLEQRLAEQGYAHRVVNASISGDTSVGGRARLPAALQSHDPAIVILELGGNDGLLGMPIADIRANLEALVEMSMEAGARVLLLGIQIPPNYGPVYAEQFAALYPTVAERYQLSLVPFLLEGIALDPELMQGDRIHPKAAAQPLILDLVWPELEPLLVETVAVRAWASQGGTTTP